MCSKLIRILKTDLSIYFVTNLLNDLAYRIVKLIN